MKPETKFALMLGIASFATGLTILIFGQMGFSPEPSTAITQNYIELADGHWYNPVDKSCYTESYGQSFLVENLSACANTVK